MRRIRIVIGTTHGKRSMYVKLRQVDGDVLIGSEELIGAMRQS